MRNSTTFNKRTNHKTANSTNIYCTFLNSFHQFTKFTKFTKLKRFIRSSSNHDQVQVLQYITIQTEKLTSKIGRIDDIVSIQNALI